MDYQYNYLHKRFLALWLVDEWNPLHFRTSRKAASLHCRRSRSWLAKSCGGGGGGEAGEAGGEVPSPRPFTPPPPQLFARHERERQQCRLQSHSSFLQHYWDLGRRGLTSQHGWNSPCFVLRFLTWRFEALKNRCFVFGTVHVMNISGKITTISSKNVKSYSSK